ncbi:MAG: OmpA family protein [Pirellulaceae bacterium]|nr:OmpA family protein [Pirellulaceae bacterium]
METFRLPLLMRGLLLSATVVVLGCAQNPNATNPYQTAAGQPSWNAAAQAGSPLQSQLQDAQRRLAELDANNRDLHARMAQAQQEAALYRDQLALVQKRLSDTASQLQQAQASQQEIERRAETLQASLQRRGGAMITANNSVRQSLETVNIPGLDVRTEGDVIRIVVPADQLFTPGTASFLPGATVTLDRIAAAISQNYPRQRVAIEAHTDSAATTTGSQAASSHHLAASQAQGVFEQWTRRNRLPPRQLFVVAHGDNHPRVSNATPAGRAENRRLEVVVYPEPFSG